MIGAVSERPRKVKDLSTGQRLAAAAYAAPHEGKIFGTIEVDASEALRFLKQKREEGVRLTMIHMVVRSAALALRDVVPELNRMIRRGQLYQRPTVDIFVSVGMNRGRDISGFKISRADGKPLEEIGREIKSAALRMRRGDQAIGLMRIRSVLEAVPTPLLRPAMQLIRFLLMDLGVSLAPLGVPEDPFGSLLVTDIGSFGLDVGYPALLPLSSASCIVAVGQVSQRAVVRDGEVVARPILTLSGTFDHRIADAYHAGALVRAARHYIEHPELL